MNLTLTDHEQLRLSFARDGVVAIPGFLQGRQFEELQEQLERFLRDTLPSLPPEDAFYEDKTDRSTLKQVQRMGQHDSWFQDLHDLGGFYDLAESLLGGPVVDRDIQLFSKPPGSGRPTPPHQDGYYFMLDPCEALTMWLALDEIDERNGCVRYVRGSHLRGMREHARTTTLGFSQGIVDYPTEQDRRDEVAIAARPGDLLVHHAMTVHRADGNQSTSLPRRALGLVYFSERAREDKQAQAAYQKRLAEEMKAQGRI